MRFKDRADAGRRLGALLASCAAGPGYVLGIPRGGIVVAAEVARMLAWPLHAVSVKKVAHPLNPELAVGAVAPDGTVVINHEAVRVLAIEPDELERAIATALEEARQRERLYGQLPDIQGRPALVVDDGLATGYTAIAAARYVRQLGARPVVIAAPVAARASARLILDECDRVVALTTPSDLEAVGHWYDDFRPVDDAVVVSLLQELATFRRPAEA